MPVRYMPTQSAALGDVPQYFRCCWYPLGAAKRVEAADGAWQADATGLVKHLAVWEARRATIEQAARAAVNTA